MSGVDFEVSIPQLRAFLAVVDAGSVAEAGRRLGMSAASVSKAITRLEEGAGVRLVHRSTHSLSLTEAGEELLEPARDAVRTAEAFEQAATHAADGGAAGVVRITASVGLVRHVLVPLVGELALVHPDIRVDIRVTNEMIDLADAGIDLALRSGALGGVPGHLHQTWFTCPWVICATPAYLERRSPPRTIGELDGHDLVGFKNPRSGRIQPWPHRGGSYVPRPHVTLDDGEACLGAMLNGAGITCTPLYLAGASLRSGAAVELLADVRGEHGSVVLLRRDRRLTPDRLTKLMTFLIARTPDFSDLL